MRGAPFQLDRVRRWSTRRRTKVQALIASSMMTLAAPTTLAIHVDAAVRANPYASRAPGFDLSFPNCSASLHHGRRFAVVGVGNGRPFTANPCAGAEWRDSMRVTGMRPSLYFNTGYMAGYGEHVGAACARDVATARVFGGRRGHALQLAERAWEIGCSETRYALEVRPGSPLMWWADVETGNSWSPHVTVNRFTLDGIAFGLQATDGHRGGGIYSTRNMWRALAGSTSWSTTPSVAAMWVAGGSCATRIGGSPTWLMQGGLADGLDADLAC